MAAVFELFSGLGGSVALCRNLPVYVDFCEKRVKTALFTVATFTSLFLPAALGMSYFWVWFLGVFLILQHFPFIFGPLLQ